MSYRNSYVDGVPLYLNKKFYPIPRSKYKEVDCHIPLDALQDGYDFSLEKQALAECEQYEKKKKEDDERKEELRIRRELKAKQDAEAAAAKAAALVREYEEELAKQHKANMEIVASNQVQVVAEVIEEPEESPQTGSTATSYLDENSGVTVIRGESYKSSEPLNVNYSQMIQPELMKPYEPLSYTSAPITKAPIAPMVPINLSDFESDTANPFDNVEMKSINEMAVLASVLQNNVTVSVPHNLIQSGEQRVTSNMNVNVNSVNGVVNQPMSYFPTYLSQSSPNPSSYNPHQWTPTTHNPFYSHFNPTMVTAATTMGTAGSSDSIPQQMSSCGPIQRPNQLENHSSTSTGVHQNNQIHPTPNSSVENFANFYFPFTSGQAQSRLKNHDREFS